LGVSVTAKEVSNTAEQNGICELDIIPDVFLEQLSHELAQLAGFQLVLDVIKVFSAGHPVLSLPLVNWLALTFHLVVLLYYACDEIEEELLLLHGQGFGIAGVHLDNNGDVVEDLG
jgi:hypothetical protein